MDLFRHKGIRICTEGEKSEKLSPREGLKNQDMTATKLSKKSLKSYSKYNEFNQSTVKKEKSHQKELQTKTEKKISNSVHLISRQGSKVFSKTTSSELQSNMLRKPAVSNWQIQKLDQNSYKCSSQNLINSSFEMGKLSLSCKLDAQRLSHIPMVQSISNHSIEGRVGVRNLKQVRPLKSDVISFQKVKFVNSISQSFNLQGISPVKQIVIPQVTERSGINSHNPTQRQESAISKQLQFKAPPQIKKVISDEYSQLIKTPSKKIQHSIQQSALLQPIPAIKKSNVIAFDQRKVFFQEERHFLEASFEHEQQPIRQIHNNNSSIKNEKRYDEFNQGQKQKLLHSYSSSQINHNQLKSSQVHNSKINSTSSKVFSASGRGIQQQQVKTCQINEPRKQRKMMQEVLQSKIQSNKEQSNQQDSEDSQNKQVIKMKALKLQHIPFARHSMQIPRSKKLSGMKVRRTISMRDQEQSEDETSQVIYGFRNTHKEAIIEDINEEMQESYMTRTEHNFNITIDVNNFRQLLQ